MHHLLKLLRALRDPIRAIRILEKHVRTLSWQTYFEKVRAPKEIKPRDFPTSYTLDERVTTDIETRLSHEGVPMRNVLVAPEDYWKFYESIRGHPYYASYISLFGHKTVLRKALELFLTLRFCAFHKNERYIDVGSERSVAGRILRDHFGCAVYELDLQNRPGIHGHRIGADAGSIPLEPGSVSGLFLHCSLEHFEGESDVAFARECLRLLQPQGWLFVSPLYLYPTDGVMTDPAALDKDVNFGTEPVYCIPGWRNRFGRLYSPYALKHRMLSQLPSGDVCVLKIANHSELGSALGVGVSPYSLLFRRGLQSTAPLL